MTVPDPAQYNDFAQGYAAHAEDAPYNALYDRPATLDLLGSVSGKRVLDAACGPGIYAAELVARGAEVIGCDASEAMVELARERVGGPSSFWVHSLDDPFVWAGDGEFDVVLCALAYHYVTDRVAFLREVRRMLAPGGRLIVSTHHPIDDWARLGGSYFEVASVTEVWNKGWAITTWRMPLGQLTSEFFDAGFVIERLLEPLPVPEMQRSHPKIYDKLMHQPAFVLFELRARPGDSAYPESRSPR